MKAAVVHRYGPPEVVSLQDISLSPPMQAGPGQILIEVEAAGLTVADARIRAAKAPEGMAPLIRLVFGVTAPRRKVPGREFSGRVIGLGVGVTQFALGDAVFGVTDGMRLGAHAEQLVVSAKGLVKGRPDSLSAEQAAAFAFGGLTAADFLLDQCSLQPGERLLVVGATGAVGSAAVQIGRHVGAHVTAMASAANLGLARDLGAHEVLDYAVQQPRGDYDVILDIPGVWPSEQHCLAPGGRLGRVTATLAQMLSAVFRPGRAQGRRVCSGVVKETPAALERLLTIHRAGGYMPLVETVLPFDQIVAAHRMADSLHKRGNIVLRMR